MAEITYESAFPGRFLKAALLNGKNTTVTLERVYMEELEGDKGKENKLIAAFEGKKLEFVLCKTNAFCLREMWGSKVAGWLGKRVTLMPTTTNFGPKKVDCIRIFGSPDIPVPLEVSARIGRKQFKATLARVMPGQHGFKGGEPSQPAAATSAYDEQFDILDWPQQERQQFLAKHQNADASTIAALLGAEIDRRDA